MRCCEKNTLFRFSMQPLVVCENGVGAQIRVVGAETLRIANPPVWARLIPSGHG
jgi:hypothetical protein